MTRLSRLPPDYGRTAFALGSAAFILLLVLGFFSASSAMHGLLTALLFWLGLSAGSLVLLMIHALTGGGWGEAARPRLVFAAKALPVTALGFIPLLLLPSLLYPWAREASAVPHSDVAALYLNPLSFGARSVVTLLLWSALAVLATGSRRMTPLVAGVGLALFGVTISFSGVDWVLSLDPRFNSTAFAMSLAVSQMLAATASSLLGRGLPERAASDLFKLAVAAGLGLLYLDLMQFLVSYDGNLPDKADWYLRRGDGGWLALILFAHAAMAVLPFLVLLWNRPSERVQRLTAASILFGVLARTIWLVLPESAAGPASFVALFLAFAGVGSIWFASGRRWARVASRADANKTAAAHAT